MILAYMQFFDRETWRFVNSFAPWLAALGTFTAALTALYLAHRHARVRLRIATFVETQNESGRLVSYATMDVVNDGPRDVTITEAYWEFSGDKRIEGTSLSNSSDALPARLRDGDAVSFRCEHLARILSTFDGAQVKAVVRTSTGKEFSARLSSATLLLEVKKAAELSKK